MIASSEIERVFKERQKAEADLAVALERWRTINDRYLALLADTGSAMAPPSSPTAMTAEPQTREANKGEGAPLAPCDGPLPPGRPLGAARRPPLRRRQLEPPLEPITESDKGPSLRGVKPSAVSAKPSVKPRQVASLAAHNGRAMRCHIEPPVARVIESDEGLHLRRVEQSPVIIATPSLETPERVSLTDAQWRELGLLVKQSRTAVSSLTRAVHRILEEKGLAVITADRCEVTPLGVARHAAGRRL